MRRTRLNVVPPVSKEIALGPVINGANGVNGAMNGALNGAKNGSADKMVSLPAQMAATAVATHKLVGEEIVTSVATAPRETRTQRVKRLQEEARALAREQIGEFELLLDATTKMATEIADGGEVYSIGAREICRRLADELPRTLQTLQVISKKKN